MQGDRLCCRYFVGKSHVEIIIPGDPRTKITPTIWDLKGISVETFERGQRKGTPDGAVTPSEVASYVAGVQVRTGVSHER
jgi:hypothetical protein